MNGYRTRVIYADDETYEFTPEQVAKRRELIDKWYARIEKNLMKPSTDSPPKRGQRA